MVKPAITSPLLKKHVSPKEKYFIVAYLLLLIIHLFGRTYGDDIIGPVTKPLLLISLGLYFFFHSRKVSHSKFVRLMLPGLVFSLLGDILLIYEGEGFFIGGLVAFLLAHVFYIAAFSDTLKNGTGGIRLTWAYIIVAAFSATYFYILKDNLGEMLIPVAVYVLVITMMLIMAIRRYGRVSSSSFVLCVIGAVLFVASDSFLAWNKFMGGLENSHLLIMSTYGLAQLFIALGALRQVQDIK